MKPPEGFPSLTAEWHNDTYPSIDPSNPAISAKGKTVIVTGGGKGIGPEFARAFAQAGAAHVALLGRTQGTLTKAKDAIRADFPSSKVTTHTADVADEVAVRKAAEEVGPWDVLILNAGLASRLAPIADIGLDEWWKVFEVCTFMELRPKPSSFVGQAPSRSIRRPAFVCMGIPRAGVSSFAFLNTKENAKCPY